ncbi:hypothetical protein EJB05_51025, partial [Eragrostis curvula]
MSMDAGGLRRLLAAAAAAEARADIFFTVDTTEARRRREDQMICDESLQKKRRDGYDAAAPLMTHCSAPQQKVRPDLAGSARLDGLQAMVQAVRSDDPAVQLEATTQFRKLLTLLSLQVFFGCLRMGNADNHPRRVFTEHVCHCGPWQTRFH